MKGARGRPPPGVPARPFSPLTPGTLGPALLHRCHLPPGADRAASFCLARPSRRAALRQANPRLAQPRRVLRRHAPVTRPRPCSRGPGRRGIPGRPCVHACVQRGRHATRHCSPDDYKPLGATDASAQAKLGHGGEKRQCGPLPGSWLLSQARQGEDARSRGTRRPRTCPRPVAGSKLNDQNAWRATACCPAAPRASSGTW